MIKILGSGLAGCLAAVMFPKSIIYEPREKTAIHKAVLRFRSDQISKVTGIPFKKVKVYKGIWHNGAPVQLAPKYICRYAMKVSSKITARSIIHQETVDRYIAPDDFHSQILDTMNIVYNTNAQLILENASHHIISTIPLPVTCNLLNITIPVNTMIGSNIYINRFSIVDCDIHMTNYYTGTDTSIYRASIVGDTLITESTFPLLPGDIDNIKASFGIDGIPIKLLLQDFKQSNGKIMEFDTQQRKDIIYKLTKDHNVYSLGRFATWRNIIMDDVYKDIEVIKSIINKSHYDRSIGR